MIFINWVEVCILEIQLILDASLTERGRKYAKALARFIDCNSSYSILIIPVQREEFRTREIEKYYADKLSEVSVKLPDSPGPGTPTGMPLIKKLTQILPLPRNHLA